MFKSISASPPWVMRAFRRGGGLFLLLTACTTGPEHQPPTSALPGVEARAVEDLPLAGEVPEAEWWAALGDPQLERLIRRAVSANYSLEAASARVRAARHLVGTEKARLRPQVGASAAYTEISLSEKLPILEDFMARGMVAEDQQLGSAGFDAAWEIDVFGGARRRVEAAEARAEAADAGRRGAQLTVVAEVARTYFQLRNRQAQAEWLDRRHDLAGELAEWSRTRLRTGMGREAEVARAEARVLALEARKPEMNAAIDAAMNRLAVLCGQSPDTLREPLSTGRIPDSPPDLVPTGLSGDLLRRRPDIRSAEREWAAATAGVGVRTADQYPDFLLTGSVGRQAQTFTDVADSAGGTWMIAPSIQWTFYQGGGVRAGVEAAQAKRDAAEAAYRETVMRAVGETETRLTQYAAAFETRRKWEAVVARRQQALRVAEDGFKAGVVSEGSVLQAKFALAEAESKVHQARTDVLIILAALHKALGGGWAFPEASES